MAPSLSTAQRRFLYLTAFVNGAAIMIVEILGAKMLAPYLGTSHFVWTAQIGIAMVSLAVGYYVGGLWSDAAARLDRLFAAMLGAALYLALTVVCVRPVAVACLEFPLPVASLLASLFLFLIPLSLLAMTGPFLVRFLTHQLQTVGGAVGRLSSLSTVGSLGGTALIGYLLIPLAPNSVTMSVTAGVVAVVALVHFAIWGRKAVPAAVAAAAVAATAALGVQRDLGRPMTRVKQLFRGNSNFGQLQVLESSSGALRFYLNDYLMQNTYDPDTRQSGSVFTYALHELARTRVENLRSVLCIGLGIGIVPSLFAQEGVRVDVVEINPAVVPIAERFFDLDASRMNIALGDGRQFLNRCTNRYDAVVLDAFLGDSSPAHLMTREAFASMRDVLNPEGVLVINCFGDTQRGRDFFLASLTKTLRAAFTHVELHASENGNAFFVASQAPLRTFRQTDPQSIHPLVRDNVLRVLARTQETDPLHGRVLTDDFNPVEFHDAANRERLRRNLAQNMRDL
ncbi:MAG: fused MFS/spermidine synthase [Verrucomicrobiales bacterium]|nr:fused MFS/spermidine synthase [Verrucomicrobiales bacterium]